MYSKSLTGFGVEFIGLPKILIRPIAEIESSVVELDFIKAHCHLLYFPGAHSARATNKIEYKIVCLFSISYFHGKWKFVVITKG